ncbi:MAG: YggS family pyridoxal phosphate-dependent enzyme [Gemmatimonadaceae bacterium]|jgi:hypothetical protein|nr:YggS family pyridoxal phosphate-dependent enzyme [Gemmatimonadaceae bacterium]
MPTSALLPELDSRLAEVRDRIAAAAARAGRSAPVRVVAVTKTHGAETVDAAVAAGLTDVGENKVQEALEKMAVVRSAPRWHLIGHLQRNKAKHAPAFAMVHSLDSERLAIALDEAAAARGVVLDVLVQVNVSGEATKGGVEPSALAAFADQLHGCLALRVAGVMTMAPYTDEATVLRQVFRAACACGEQLERAGHPAVERSMGMSNDYEIAVEEGATMVRLGSVLFGSRH